MGLQVSNTAGSAADSGCQFCEAGSVKYPTGTAGNATCLLAGAVCGSSSYSNGTGVCLKCGAGQVRVAVSCQYQGVFFRSMVCCRTGTGQVWNGTSCQSCPAGQVPSTSGPGCEPCAAGYVKQPAGSPVDATCVPAGAVCGSSSYSNGTGVCLKCGAGKVRGSKSWFVSGRSIMQTSAPVPCSCHGAKHYSTRPWCLCTHCEVTGAHIIVGCLCTSCNSFPAVIQPVRQHHCLFTVTHCLQVSNTEWTGCQNCPAGTVKWPPGTTSNATCMPVAIVCGNGSYADGSGICKYCNTTSVSDAAGVQCYPCTNPMAANGGPGMTKYPKTKEGQCVPDPCSAAPCKNGGKCSMTGLETVNCTCTAAWTGTYCFEVVPDTDLQIQYPLPAGQELLPVRLDLMWWRFSFNYGFGNHNCSSACSVADAVYNAGGRITAFSTKVGSYACAPDSPDAPAYNPATADTLGCSGVTAGAPPSTCTYFSPDQHHLVQQGSPQWCLCQHKRKVANVRWVAGNKTCKTLGKEWGRVVTGANALCRGASNAREVAARLVLGYTPAVVTPGSSSEAV
jgi:hypothetical protein